MSNLKINLKYSKLKESEIMHYADKVEAIHNNLQDNVKNEEAFLGWLELPKNYNKKEFDKIKKCAKEIRRKGRSFCSNWNWRLLFRSTCCNRITYKYIL